MNFIKNNKLFVFLVVPAVILLMYAQIGGFKLFVSESGHKWSPQGSNGSVHHK